jgi:dihydropteroate synthase
MHEWHLPDRLLRIERRPLVMGILNVTPDSFSDGGRYSAPEAGVAHGLELVQQGADIVDIGGESTRPGASAVPADEELRRVLPVVQALAPQISIPISIDTSKPGVARACLDAGARIINDVTALADPAMVEVACKTSAGVILMHMQGTPATMQDNPVYDDVVVDISRFFEQRLHDLADRGIAAERVVLDPGIGFGKTREHNLEILARLEEFQKLGRPVCLGVSRKKFLGKLLDRPLDQRLAGSLAAVCFALSRQAVQVVRVHDVAATVDAVQLFATIGSQLSAHSRQPDNPRPSSLADR